MPFYFLPLFASASQGETMECSLQSSSVPTFSAAFPIWTVAGLEGMTSSLRESVLLQNQVVFKCTIEMQLRA